LKAIEAVFINANRLETTDYVCYVCRPARRSVYMTSLAFVGVFKLKPYHHGFIC